MRKQHAPKATLFLMELVLVIFFFSICAAICVSIFGSAQTMADNSENVSRAAVEARSAASCFKAAEGDLEQTALLLNGVEADDSVLVYFDNNWNRTADAETAWYAVQLKQRIQPGEADVYILQLDTASDNILFSIPVKTHKEAA